MQSSTRSARIAFFSVFAASLAAPLTASAEERSSSPLTVVAMKLLPFGMDSSFEGQFDENFFNDYWKSNPEHAIALGHFDFAEHMTIPDAKSRAKSIGQLNKWLSQLHRFDPGSLDEMSRSDWVLLDNAFEAQRWALTEYRAWEWNPALYNVGAPFAIILNSDYAPLEQRLRTLLTRLGDVSSYYSTAKRNLAQPTREHTQLAIDENRHTLKILREDLAQRVAESSLRDNERALFNRRIAAAAIAIEDYVGWLQALEFQFDQRGARSFRLGRELYEQKFAYAVQSGSTAENLYKRALQEKELLLSRMDQLADVLWSKYSPNTAAPADRLEKIAHILAKLETQGTVAQPIAIALSASEPVDSVLDIHTHRSEQPQNAIRNYFGNDITHGGWSTYNALMGIEASSGTPEAWMLVSKTILGATNDTILDYSVHVLDMTEADAMQLLIRESFLSEDAARQRWHRAQLTSVQLVGNFAGFAEIYDLRESLKNEMGSRFDLARFNQQFQSYGCAPVKMIKDFMRPSLIAHVH